MRRTHCITKDVEYPHSRRSITVHNIRQLHQPVHSVSPTPDTDNFSIKSDEDVIEKYSEPWNYSRDVSKVFD